MKAERPMSLRSVDCACDPALARAVAPVGDVSSCLRCGVVTVSEAVWDEPHPHVVVTLGFHFEEVAPEVLSWLARWPRIIWTGGVAPNYFLRADARALDAPALEALEIAARKEQEGLLYSARLRWAGVPPSPPPAALPPKLSMNAKVWAAMQVTQDAPLGVLATHARDWSGVIDDVFLRRPSPLDDLLALLCSSDAVQRETAYGFIDRLLLVNDALMDAMKQRLEADDLAPQELHRLLIAVGALGERARALIPALRARAERDKGDYYGHKRLLDVVALVDRP
jgi:hypothetical protein